MTGEDDLVEKRISPLPLVDHPDQQAGRGPRRYEMTNKKRLPSVAEATGFDALVRHG